MADSFNSSNKKIAKNTLFLYLRMGIIIIVKLYTSRVLLDVLGIDDYGTWNVVAAFVVSFSFISGSLVSSIQRFINYDIGKGGVNLAKIFCTSLTVFIIFSILISVCLETGGLWFLNYKMNFNADDINTVNIIYQLSTITLVFNLIRMPFESVIIAYESMSFYAIICIFEAIFLLATAFSLKFDLFSERLILYGIFNLASSLALLLCYIIYCNRNFECVKFKFYIDKQLIKGIASFSGWSLFGTLSSMTSNQGVNILINMFFGVACNAAYGITMQIRSAVTTLVENINKAFAPQIIKNFSSEDKDRMMFLLMLSIKATSFLAFLFVFPLIFNIDYILDIWLGENIPPYTKPFAILTLIQLLIICFGSSIDIAIFATGEIKKFQIWLSLLILSNIIFAYVFFKGGYGVLSIFYFKILIEVFILITRVLFFLNRFKIKFFDLFKISYSPILITVISMTVLMYLFNYLIGFGSGLCKLILSVSMFEMISILLIWNIALTRKQRQIILNTFQRKYIRK